MSCIETNLPRCETDVIADLSEDIKNIDPMIGIFLFHYVNISTKNCKFLKKV